MKNNLSLLFRIAFAAFVGVSATARAGADDLNLECLKSAGFLVPLESPDHFKYAPDHEVQVLHLALDVTPDFKQRTIKGSAKIDFKPVLKPVRELKLDAVELDVQTVTATENIEAWQVTPDKLVITFATPIPVDQAASVTVTYQAEPRQGIYFRTPEMGYKAGDTHLFSQGEEVEARHWYPCFDSPNVKFTSEVTCHVPDGMTVISNGRLLSSDADAMGLRAFHWTQEKPHSTYLITLVAGYFKVLEGKHRDVPLEFYTPPSEAGEAETSFHDTEDVMAFFESEIGVNYPWAKYAQVCVNDFVAGGMENTSATTLTDSTLYPKETENLRDSDSLISHEMAHQWFGDLVTCKDWSDIWLNEGFATYYEILYMGHRFGRDTMLYELYENARQITGVQNDVNSIVRRSYDSPGEMFGFLAYPKGGWVLHMLRSQLGEDLYRKCIKTYLERHQYGNVVTDDLRAVIEELTGRTYDQFFDQWLFHAHQPELEVGYSWDEQTKLAKLTVRQTQKLSEAVLLFNFPLTVRFGGKSGSVDKTVQVKEKDGTWYFPLDSAPETVRVDPEYTLLAKINFSVPGPMLAKQLADQHDVIGRLLAIEQLSGRPDGDSISKLKQALNHDSFYGVREQAARALRGMHSDEAFEALLASAKQSDARVRREVVGDIADFYKDKAYDSARETLAREKNPDILTPAIRALAGYDQPAIHETLLKYLDSTSFHNELADAAIGAMRSQDDPAYIDPLLGELRNHETNFTSRGISQGLGALAYLSRNAEKKDAVREFLTGYVNHPRRGIQLAALRALGTLGDTKSIPILEKFATASKETPERGTAEQSLTELRAVRKPIDDFKNLRQSVTDLEKANRELRKDLDDLKKKISALNEAAPAPSKKKAPLQSPKSH